MPSVLKRALHWLGGALGLIGVVFVGLKLAGNADQIDLRGMGAPTWFTLLFLALLYGLANTLLARAWHALLKMVGVRPTWTWTLRTYGVSQLAKYIPGNIFQLAGRQALGQAAGFPALALAKSAFYELAFIATAGAIFAALTIPLLLPGWSVAIGLVTFLLVLAIAFYLARSRFGSDAGHALAWDTLFFILSAVVFVVTVYLMDPATVGLSLAPSLCGAYVVAWLLGFLTPGAPAGIGVRELVLAFLLGGIVSEADLLLAIVLGRLVTMLGDLGFFAYASTLRAA